MARSHSASLDRRKLMGDPIMVTTIVVLITFLTVFILYPLAILLVDSVYGSKGLSLDTFIRISNSFSCKLFEYNFRQSCTLLRVCSGTKLVYQNKSFRVGKIKYIYYVLHMRRKSRKVLQYTLLISDIGKNLLKRVKISLSAGEK